MSDIIIEIDGKEVKLRDLAKKYKVKYEFVLKRYNEGIRGLNIVRKVNTIFVKYNGKTYTVKELSKETGIKEHVIRDRVSRGYPDNEVVEGHCSLHKYDVYGEQLTTREVSVKYQINVETFLSRYRRGLRGNRLISRNKGRRIYVTIEGKEMSLIAISETYNININVIRARFRRGYRDEDILFGGYVTMMYKGKKALVSEVAKLEGIKYGTLKDRLRRGKKGDALFVPCAKRDSDIKMEINGEYLNLNEIAEKYNINYSTVRSRYYQGKNGDEMIVRTRKYRSTKLEVK